MKPGFRSRNSTMSDFFVCAMLNTYTFVFFLFLSCPVKLSYNSFKHSEPKK